MPLEVDRLLDCTTLPAVEQERECRSEREREVGEEPIRIRVGLCVWEWRRSASLLDAARKGAAPVPTAPSLDHLRAALDSIGQCHVLAFWDDLGDAGRACLGPAGGAGPPWCSGPRGTLATAKPDRACRPTSSRSPPQRPGGVVAGSAGTSGRWSGRLRGKVACFTVAGTRLGYDGPGCYPAGAVTGKPV